LNKAEIYVTVLKRLLASLVDILCFASLLYFIYSFLGNFLFWQNPEDYLGSYYFIKYTLAEKFSIQATLILLICYLFYFALIPHFIAIPG
jgi:hypothetical protein